MARELKAAQVLIVTNRPAIANSWFDDFEKFIAWQTDFAFVSTADTLKNRSVMTRDDFLNQHKNGKQNMLAFISLQDLKGAICFDGQHDKLDWVSQMNWDLLVIDEAHEGVDTLKTDVAFNNIKRNFTLHLSGTPFKAIARDKFQQDEIFNWTYADEQRKKAEWNPENEQNNPYAALPRLNLFSYQMSQMITDQVNQGANIDGENIDFTFDLNEFFATNDSGKFIHEADVNKWLDTLTKNEKYPFSTKALRDELKHTFWLLNRVASAKALEKLLKDHPVFENYEIILAAGDGRSLDEDMSEASNQKSLDRVRKAIAKYDKTITLSVGQLTTGVTVPEWTAVLMLSNMKSSSDYIQAAFRAQNPWQYTINGKNYQKENAYVFDFAPERTLIIYDEFANDLSSDTSNGKGTSETRSQNIQQLLNFFPVIGEDSNGKMVELDVNQIMTIPKMLKASEVVRRGFMSNLLFQNVSGIFASPAVRAILEKIPTYEDGKLRQASEIDTQNVEIDENGKAIVQPEIVIVQTAAKFGEKVYANIQAAAEQIITKTPENIATAIAQQFTQQVTENAKALTKEVKITPKAAENVVKAQAQVLAREIEIVQRQADIEQKTAETVYQKAVAQIAPSDTQKLAEIQAAYEVKKQEIQQQTVQKITQTVAEQTQVQTAKTTQIILQQAEDKKQNTVEDEFRKQLRSFTRTIPAFLMAYGDRDTQLNNFDERIDADVFHAITNITLDEFRLLRDEYEFFDEIVFNQSVQEFLNKRETLANYFDEHQREDIFDYIPPQQNNQIYTPKKVMKMIIDKLEAENPNIFRQPETKFADLYMKSGLYLTEIVKRLFKGLKDQIPDDRTRLKHIMECQIYGFAPSEIIYNIARNFIFGFDPLAVEFDTSHIVCLDTTPYAMGNADFDAKLTELFGENVKFDAIVGNPPYQENRDDTSDAAIYHYFYDLAKEVGEKYCLISPARFLFNAGQTPVEWNQKMLNDEHLKVVFYEQNSANIFPTPDIKGELAIVYRDEHKHFGKIGIFTHFPELNSILAKVTHRDDFEPIIPIMHLQQKFNLDTLYEDYPNLKSKIGSQGREKRLTTSIFSLNEIFTENETAENNIKILGLIKNQRVYRFINKKYLENHGTLYQWKVILPKSNGSGALGEVLSTPLVGTPLVGHTQSFISIGCFDDELLAEHCLKYVKTKFARTMLGVLKVTQDNNPPTWAYVPLQDFTAQSDIDWTASIADIDRQLYEKYGLSEAEIAFIESKVKAMD
ncbi:Helicase A859L [Kingella kingae]|nr:Helicase A859L [Kingella kingae]